jgi:hypothetical protein
MSLRSRTVALFLLLALAATPLGAGICALDCAAPPAMHPEAASHCGGEDPHAAPVRPAGHQVGAGHQCHPDAQLSPALRPEHFDSRMLPAIVTLAAQPLPESLNMALQRSAATSPPPLAFAALRIPLRL